MPILANFEPRKLTMPAREITVIIAYNKCSKFQTFISCSFQNKKLLNMAEIQELLVRILNRVDPDQIAS